MKKLTDEKLWQWVYDPNTRRGWLQRRDPVSGEVQRHGAYAFKQDAAKACRQRNRAIRAAIAADKAGRKK